MDGNSLQIAGMKIPVLLDKWALGLSENKRAMGGVIQWKNRLRENRLRGFQGA